MLFMFGCAVLLAAISPLSSKVPSLAPELFVGVLTSVGTFLLTFVFVRWERLRLSDVGAAPGRLSAARLVFGFAVGLVMVLAWAGVLRSFGHIRFVRGAGVSISAIMISLIGFLALAFREELAFRGYPLRRLESAFGPWAAQLLVAMVFAAEHRLGGWPWDRALFGAGVGSIMFGMAALATRGLTVPIGVHAAWNFGQWMLGLGAGAGMWNAVVAERQEAASDEVRTLGYLAVMSVATLAFWLWYRVRQRPRNGMNRSPNGSRA